MNHPTTKHFSPNLILTCVVIILFLRLQLCFVVYKMFVLVSSKISMLGRQLKFIIGPMQHEFRSVNDI